MSFVVSRNEKVILTEHLCIIWSLPRVVLKVWIVTAVCFVNSTRLTVIITIYSNTVPLIFVCTGKTIKYYTGVECLYFTSDWELCVYFTKPSHRKIVLCMIPYWQTVWYFLKNITRKFHQNNLQNTRKQFNKKK